MPNPLTKHHHVVPAYLSFLSPGSMIFSVNPIEQAQEQLTRTTGRMLRLLDSTPDDKLFWKPSQSARSIAEVVAHSAHALGNIAGQLKGTPFPIATSAEANQVFLEHDKQFSDRETVVKYFQNKRDEYLDCLQSIKEEDLEEMVTMPFGLGEAPMRFFMTVGSLHTQGHTNQIEYIQTIFGDHNWHMGI